MSPFGWRRVLAAACIGLLLFVPRLPRAGAQEACPPLPPPYDGPIFDANVQSWNPDVGDIPAAMQSAGVQRMALFANSREGAQSDTARAVAALARANPETIVPGAPKIGFIFTGDLPSGYIAETVAGVKSGDYRFVGEILYTHGDKPDHKPTKTGEVRVDPGGRGTKDLLTQLAPYDVPVLTHWEAWAWDRDQAHFDALYAAWPKQRFVVPSVLYGSPDKIEAVLSAHPNVWATISRIVDGRYQFVDPEKQAKLGPNMFDACGALVPAWRAVLLAHADRLMYGSDFYTEGGRTWEQYPFTIARYRRIAGQLPPEVARRISFDTAAALYARP